MLWRGCFAILVSAIVACLYLWSAVLAQAQDELLWFQALKIQIAEEYNCTVKFFINAHSYKLGDDEVYEAQIICMDERQFDAVRTGEIQSFKIKSCEPVVC